MTISPSDMMLDGSVLVVCHPDDELLWFGSILRDVDRVIVAYEDAWFDKTLGDRRRRALAAFPRPIESLGLGEAGSAGCGSWARPRPTPHGLAFGFGARRFDLKQAALRGIGRGQTPHPTRASHYAANYHALVDRLAPMLDGAANVFTHNAWGEYGHEDHVQMFRAVSVLRERFGFRQWMTNYVTDRSIALARTYLGDGTAERIVRPIDRDYCESVAEVYRDAGCWTWADHWDWFPNETFTIAPWEQSAVVPAGNDVPLNAFRLLTASHLDTGFRRTG